MHTYTQNTLIEQSFSILRFRINEGWIIEGLLYTNEGLGTLPNRCCTGTSMHVALITLQYLLHYFIYQAIVRILT